MKPMSLDQVINLQNKLVPEMVQLLIERYKVLRQISHDQPVGRRTLAKTLGISERILRSHVDFLKEAGLLDFSLTGMSITEEGAALLQELQDYVNRLQKLSSLAQLLEEKLHLQKAVVIPGDADLDPVGTRKLAGWQRASCCGCWGPQSPYCGGYGGTTMAALAENIYGNEPHCTVVPARGGLGDKMELQANTIATVLAGRLKTKYLQLYVPDSVSEDVLDKILEEDAGVKQVVETIKVLTSWSMAWDKPRSWPKSGGVDPCIIARLKEEGAVGEALGQYFSLDGRVVYSTDTLGLMVNDLEKIHTVMGIAGGHSKGPAILSVLRSGKQDILVTDEAAAREIINCLQMENNHKLDNI